jgi:N-acetylated-alpha-linked acidic dipeptidase
VQKLLKDKQDSVREQNRQIDEGVFAATNDPREPLVPPKKEEIPPYLNFAPLDNAVDALTRAADRYQKALTKTEANGGAALTKTDLKALNARSRWRTDCRAGRGTATRSTRPASIRAMV